MFITVTVIVVSTVIVNYLFVYLFIHSFTEKLVGGAFEYEY